VEVQVSNSLKSKKTRSPSSKMKTRRWSKYSRSQGRDRLTTLNRHQRLQREVLLHQDPQAMHCSFPIQPTSTHQRLRTTYLHNANIYSTRTSTSPRTRTPCACSNSVLASTSSIPGLPLLNQRKQRTTIIDQIILPTYLRNR